MSVNTCTALIPYKSTEETLGLAMPQPLKSPSGKTLSTTLLNGVLEYIGPKDLESFTLASKACCAFARATNQWKRQCQIRLNIPFSVEPLDFLPAGCPSYKEGARLAAAPRVLDG